MRETFNEGNFYVICDRLGELDPDLAAVINQYSYPPLWTRTNSFESLVHIILEQQVSLASALSALNKLKEYIGELTPSKVLSLTDDEFKACYFSRQKMTYTRGLADAITKKQIDLTALGSIDDELVREQLIQLKGIGNWTIDVYLMFVLRRTDIFPVGDLAAVKALMTLKPSSVGASRDELLNVARQWAPYRTIATMILWHYYLSAPRRKFS